MLPGESYDGAPWCSLNDWPAEAKAAIRFAGFGFDALIATLVIAARDQPSLSRSSVGMSRVSPHFVGAHTRRFSQVASQAPASESMS